MNGLVTQIKRETREEVEVSQQVQQRLKQADELELAVRELTEKLSDVNKELGRKDTELRALRQLDLDAKELATRQQLLDARENKLDLREELNDLKVQSQSDRVADHKEMFQSVFRNSVIRQSTLKPCVVGSGERLEYSGSGDQVAVDGGSFVEDRAETSETTEE